jgi:ribosomal protein S18 acetylase RimI-like enzyme
VTISVRPLGDDEREWARRVIVDRWGSERVVAHGVAYEPVTLPGLVAEVDGRPAGLLTFHVDADACEIVTIDAFEPRRGIGTSLIDALASLGHGRLWLVTTNDNEGAQRFYERLGFRLVAVHEGAVARSRAVKPEIPGRGHGGVPIRDELEYERRAD